MKNLVAWRHLGGTALQKSSFYIAQPAGNVRQMKYVRDLLLIFFNFQKYEARRLICILCCVSYRSELYRPIHCE